MSTIRPQKKEEIDLDKVTFAEIEQIVRDELWRRSRLSGNRHPRSAATKRRIAAGVRAYHARQRAKDRNEK